MSRSNRGRSPRVRVVVTQEMIDSAVRGDSGHCMNAEAVKAAVPTATSVAVDLQTIRFSDPGRRLRYVYLTPRIAQEALVDFDMGRKIEPYSFLLMSAQTLSMSRKRTGRPPAPATTAQLEALGKANRFRLSASAHGIPEVVGGKAPPHAALATGARGRRRGGATPVSRRRQFGLRGLERGSSRLLDDRG